MGHEKEGGNGSFEKASSVQSHHGYDLFLKVKEWIGRSDPNWTVKHWLPLLKSHPEIAKMQDQLGHNLLMCTLRSESGDAFDALLPLTDLNQVNIAHHNALQCLCDRKHANTALFKSWLMTLLHQMTPEQRGLKSCLGSTALITAIRQGNHEVVPLLIPFFDVKETDRDGKSALFYAIECGALGVVRELLPHSEVEGDPSFKKSEALKKLIITMEWTAKNKAVFYLIDDYKKMLKERDDLKTVINPLVKAKERLGLKSNRL